MKRPVLPAAVLSAAVALLVAGCGGASTSASGPITSAPRAASSTSGAPAPPTSKSSTGVSSGPASAGTSNPAAQQPVSPEVNPPGDIPDNLAFVSYANAAGRYSFTHPEGWLQQVKGAAVLFTDKLNGVQVDQGTATSAPTVISARADSVPALTRSQAAFELRSVTAVSMPRGTGVLIVYRRNSAPDQVTGRQYRDEVQRYELVANGHEVIVELFGPVGADNVDAYRTMITSLKQS